MQIGETFYKLFKEVFCDILCKLATFTDVGQEVTSRTEFHHKANVFAGLEGVVEADNALMIRLLQDGELLHHFFLLWVFSFWLCRCITFVILGASEDIFVDTFNSDQLLTYLMCGEIDFAECPTP